MLVDRHAATVVDHGQIAAFLKGDLDERGVAGDGFVHRIVDHFSKQMMQCVGVGPPDIHARSPAHGLQALEHFDRGGGIVCFVGRADAMPGLPLTGAGFPRWDAPAPKRSFMSCTFRRIAPEFNLPRAGENENRTSCVPRRRRHAKGSRAL